MSKPEKKASSAEKHQESNKKSFQLNEPEILIDLFSSLPKREKKTKPLLHSRLMTDKSKIDRKERRMVEDKKMYEEAKMSFDPYSDELVLNLIIEGKEM